MAVSTVYVVDAELAVRNYLMEILQHEGFSVRAYDSSESFLENLPREHDFIRCLVLDLRLPGLSGLELQRCLRERGVNLPSVFVSGLVQIPVIVEAMRSGAVDFLAKPFSRTEIIRAVKTALDLDAQEFCRQAERRAVLKRIETLSEREQEVCRLLLNGKNTKEISSLLGIGVQTVAKHRIAVFSKLHVQNGVELLLAYELAGCMDDRTRRHDGVPHPVTPGEFPRLQRGTPPATSQGADARSLVRDPPLPAAAPASTHWR